MAPLKAEGCRRLKIERGVYEAEVEILLTNMGFVFSLTARRRSALESTGHDFTAAYYSAAFTVSGRSFLYDHLKL